MKLKKITDDYYIVTKETTPEDLIGRTVARALRDKKRDKPSTPKLPSRDRSKEYQRKRSIRLARKREGLCTACPKKLIQKPEAGFRYCLDCRILWRAYKARYRSRRIFSLTPYPVAYAEHGLSL
jgi:hypothetical protein